MDGLNWYWITLELTVTPLMGLLLTLPFWRKADVVFGNIVGTVVILGWAIGLILREYVEVDRYINGCLAEGTLCLPQPSAFARFALYASIGFLEVFLLFTLSLTVERRQRNSSYAAEWRR